ncbi:amidase signature enzyme, partial [Amylocystis lapponica]
MFPDLYEVSISELQEGLEAGYFTSVDLVKAYLDRIEEVNTQGPTLRAVIETNPSILKQAADLDSERRTSGARGPLHGIPILLKDNIATLHSEGMNTTAGSLALVGAVVPRDATVAAKLRRAGALLLGKSSLSEWSNFRSEHLAPGFSGRIGQASSPYVPQGNPSGSSSGSGIASAIGLAAAALGSDTDGSVVAPSSFCNVVGIRTSLGLTSRSGVVPISAHQDTIGPMCRSVKDLAILLGTIAGRDPLDPYSMEQPEMVPDYTTALKLDGLKGARLGVPRNLLQQGDLVILQAFDASLDTFRKLGATIVDPANLTGWDPKYIADIEYKVLHADFKPDLNKYLSELVEIPTGTKTLADLIAFNIAHAAQELPEPYWNDQTTFLTAENLTLDKTYYDALDALGKVRGIEWALDEYKLDALIMPTYMPGKDSLGSSAPAAIAGCPVLSVPLGFQPDSTALAEATPTRENGPRMPFGLAFMGAKYSETALIQYAYAFEQATHARLQQRAFPEAIPKTQLADIVGK